MTTTIVFANNNDPIKKNKKNSTAEVAELKRPSELNSDYVVVVHENASQKEAKYFSAIISEYDVRQSEGFDARDKDFTVRWKSSKGFAVASFDDDGRVINVKKVLKNIALPDYIYKHVSENYEGFEIVKNKYTVSYNLGEEVDKTYVVKLNNGKEKVKIRVHG